MNSDRGQPPKQRTPPPTRTEEEKEKDKDGRTQPSR